MRMCWLDLIVSMGSKSWVAPATLLCAAVLLGSFLEQCGGQATPQTVVIGGDAGWSSTSNVNYTEWMTSVQFKAGDTLRKIRFRAPRSWMCKFLFEWTLLFQSVWTLDAYVPSFLKRSSTAIAQPLACLDFAFHAHSTHCSLNEHATSCLNDRSPPFCNH